MPISIVAGSRVRSGLVNRRFNAVRFTLGTYATGGITVTANELNVSKLDAIMVSAPGLVASYVPTNATSGKIVLYRLPALDGNAAAAQSLAEVANAVDLSAVTATAFVVGR